MTDAVEDSLDSLFAPEDEDEGVGEGSVDPWLVLVVDDDRAVHDATSYALDRFSVDGRPIELVTAYSARAAFDILAERRDIAVALVDVVMETEHAGLDLVDAIRGDLKLDKLRIILRTGQPGTAPELDVIRRYDINDYRSKAELTAHRLQSSVINALRTHGYIDKIEEGRAGLRRIIDSTSQLMQRRGIRELSAGVIRHLAALIGTAPEGLLAISHDHGAGEDGLEVIAAAGAHEGLIGQPLAAWPAEPAVALVRAAVERRQHIIGDGAIALYIDLPHAESVVVYAEGDGGPREVDRHLLELFATNIGIGFENARLFERTRFLAYRDPLTGLLNRVGFRERLDEALAHDDPFTLVLIDADGFQEFNDGLGHTVGDKVLIGIAERLRAWLPEGAVLGRDHSDNFSVLLPGETAAQAERRAEALSAVFEPPVVVEGNALPVGVTAGAASYPEHARGGRHLHALAGTALAIAKKRARGRWISFSRDFEEQLKRRIGITRRLRPALAAGEFRLAFQPQIDLRTGRPIAAEALLRWPQPDGRFISPAEFVPAAETAGLISVLGDWVLGESAAQLAAWRGEGLDVSVAVNVSIQQAMSADFAPRLLDLLAEHAIPAGLFEVEITESLAASNVERLKACVAALRRGGVSVALDDFGTGYSSLSYLQELPVNVLKLDRSFIVKLEAGQRSIAFARTLVGMARTLEMNVVAEGVETAGQSELLREIGADVAQGYYFAKPMMVDDAGAFFRAAKCV